MTDIIELPLKPRVCTDCQHGALSQSGVYCLLFEQPVDNECADDCDGYDPIGAS